MSDRPELVGIAGDPVAFLDAPGLDASELLDTVDGVLAGMQPGAILTVYTDDPAAADAAVRWCGGRGAELLAIIPHDPPGTTLTIRCS